MIKMRKIDIPRIEKKFVSREIMILIRFSRIGYELKKFLFTIFFYRNTK